MLRKIIFLTIFLHFQLTDAANLRAYNISGTIFKTTDGYSNYGPLAGANITAWYNTLEKIGEAETDEHGHFVITGSKNMVEKGPVYVPKLRYEESSGLSLEVYLDLEAEQQKMIIFTGGTDDSATVNGRQPLDSSQHQAIKPFWKQKRSAGMRAKCCWIQKPKKIIFI